MDNYSNLNPRLNLDFLEVNFESKTVLTPNDENKYIHKVIGKLCLPDDENLENLSNTKTYIDTGKKREKLIGQIEFDIMLLNLVLNEGASIHKTFDLDSHNYQVGQGIIDFEKGEFNSNIQNMFPDHVESNVMIIREIKILPEYRKLLVGQELIRRSIELFGNSCCLAALIAFPTQFNAMDDKDDLKWMGFMNYDEFTDDLEEAQLKLYNYYTKLGFKRVSESNVFILGLEYENPLMS